MVTTFPLMLHEPGVLELSIPNVTCKPDDAVLDSVYGVDVAHGLHGSLDVIVIVCDACATLNGCCAVTAGV